MRFFVTADQHIANHVLHGGPAVGGLNNRCRLAADTLGAAIRIAHEHGYNTMVGAGDMFDSASPTPPVVAEVRRQLHQVIDGSALILGNHEVLTDQDGDSATEVLGCLSRDDTTVHRHPYLLDGRVLLVPHDPTRTCLEALKAALGLCEGVCDPVDVVIAHFGVYDDTDPEHLHGPRSAHVKDVAETLKGTAAENALVLCGDWHQHRVLEHDGVEVVQIGALCPVGWRDAGWCGYGSVILVDVTSSGATWRRLEVPGPRFLKGSAKDVRRHIEALGTGVGLKPEDYTVFARVTDHGHFPVGLANVVERPPVVATTTIQRRSSDLSVERAALDWCRENSKDPRVARRAVEMVNEARRQRG